MEDIEKYLFSQDDIVLTRQVSCYDILGSKDKRHKIDVFTLDF